MARDRKQRSKRQKNSTKGQPYVEYIYGIPVITSSSRNDLTESAGKVRVQKFLKKYPYIQEERLTGNQLIEALQLRK